MKILMLCIFIFSSFSLHADERKILIIGDSVTEGYGVPKTLAYPTLVEKELKKKDKRIKVVNAGSSGSTSASAFARLKWHLKVKPEILILALGGNDGLRGIQPEATKKNLKKAIELAKSQNVKVILAGMQMPFNYGPDYRKKFAAVYRELTKEHDLTLIPFLLKGVGGVKKLNLADGIHPNEKGHEIVAKNVLEILRKVL